MNSFFFLVAIHSQYEYRHKTFSYKDDSRGGEYLINRIFSMRRNAPLSRICDRSLVFEGAKTQICELSNVSLVRNIGGSRMMGKDSKNYSDESNAESNTVRKHRSIDGKRRYPSILSVVF